MAKKLQVSYKCQYENFIGSTVVAQDGKKNFTCQACDKPLYVNLQSLEIGAHGHAQSEVKHDFLNVRELGREE